VTAAGASRARSSSSSPGRSRIVRSQAAITKPRSSLGALTSALRIRPSACPASAASLTRSAPRPAGSRCAARSRPIAAESGPRSEGVTGAASSAAIVSASVASTVRVTSSVSVTGGPAGTPPAVAAADTS